MSPTAQNRALDDMAEAFERENRKLRIALNEARVDANHLQAVIDRRDATIEKMENRIEKYKAKIEALTKVELAKG